MTAWIEDETDSVQIYLPNAEDEMDSVQLCITGCQQGRRNGLTNAHVYRMTAASWPHP